VKNKLECCKFHQSGVGHGFRSADCCWR